MLINEVKFFMQKFEKIFTYQCGEYFVQENMILDNRVNFKRRMF